MRARLLGIEKGREEAKEGIRCKGIIRGSQEERDTGHRAVTRSLVCHRVSLGAFRDEVCPDPYDRIIPLCVRTSTKSKLHVLLTVRPHGILRNHTVPSGRIKIKAKNGISSF
ncbi:hypothetical protein PIB30_096214 [Stylosanthes scabra]|uniref:Uncharacterized protein n=1 Tax=Stylosanthes scabra TaxID=79078 RepID=A0ABU6YU70_9FABA|nr:hypothetical protein [Stylosanthes scabra]